MARHRPVPERNASRHRLFRPLRQLHCQQTLPSLAFGLKSCSIKWKQKPQDQAIKGAKSGPNAAPRHPVWIEAQRRGVRIVKLIGYDRGRADLRRSRNLAVADADFDYAYPLQILGWNRTDCVRAITDALGADMVPIKSACFFCPASKIWELWWLAAHHPDLLERALVLERNALTERHSRFDEVEFGGSWDAASQALQPQSVSDAASPGTSGRGSTASSTMPSA